MNNKMLLLEIASVLKDHKWLWQHELLTRYPHIESSQYDDWVKYLQTLSDHETLHFENSLKIHDNAPTELRQLLQRIKNIYQQIPIHPLKEESYENHKTHLNRKMSFKKNHEIHTIVDDLSSLARLGQFENVIDIGAGAGHLSQVIVEKLNVEAHCYEVNTQYVEQAQERIHKYYRHLTPRFHFHTIKVDGATYFNRRPKTLMMGLHACGGLSNDLIDHCIHGRHSLYNYGCCYFKPDTKTNLSTLAQDLNFQITADARHLAAHSYHPLDEKMFQARQQSKMYRYPLHFLMYEKLHIYEFIGFKKKTVAMDGLTFSDYVLKQLQEIDIAHSLCSNDINSFLNDPIIQTKLNYLMPLNIIRGLFGRLLELFIILDRALYLEENQFSVEIKQTFDRKLSPRNLRIWAIPKE